MPVETTDKYVRVRARDPGDFQEGSLRTIDISREMGIRAVIGRLKGETSTTVQSYLFDKERWDEERAVAWVEKHKAEKGEIPGKAGARHSAGDRDLLKQIHNKAKDIEQHAVDLGAELEEALEEAASTKASGTDAIDAEPIAVWGSIIKAAGDWTLDVLGLPYGGPHKGRDSQGEYFSADTKWLLDRGFPELPPAVYYHGFSPEGKPMGAPEYIGRTVKRWADSAGIWYRVALDRANQWAKRVWDAAQQDKARASSGTAEHLRRVDRDGHIREWPVIELSLFDIEGDRQPANAYAVAIPAVKALYERAGLSVPDALIGSAEAAQVAPVESMEAKPDSDNKHKETNEMAELDIKTVVQEAVASALKAQADLAEAARAEAAAKQAAIDTAIKAEREKWEKEQAERGRLPFKGMPNVREYHDQQWDNLDPVDMALLHDTLSDAERKGLSKRWDPKNETFLKSMALKAVSARDKGDQHCYHGLKRLGIKADEIERSTLASYGDEWAGVLYGSAIWEKIRAGSNIVAKIPAREVPQGYESISIPLEGTDPKFYKVAQAASLPTTETTGRPNATVTSSQVGTPTPKSLTVAKIGARVLYTGEMEEDSIVPWLPQLRAQLEKAGREQLEFLVIDGDTDATATTNINAITGTPAATDLFLTLNGFRQLPIIGNTANLRTAGALTVADFLETLKLLGVAGKNAAQMDAVEFIIDPWVHFAALQLAEVQTRDIFSAPTLENGVLTSIWGHKINVSHFICYAGVHMGTVTTDAYKLKSEVTGKIDQVTQADNAYGNILAVRWDQWLMGWKRRMTIETERIPDADVSQIVALARVGLVYRDTEASALSVGVVL